MRLLGSIISNAVVETSFSLVMPSGRVIIAALTIAILIGVSAGIATGVIPFALPRQASLISLSQVNIAPGGSIQNGYLVNTYWDIAFTANSYQSFVLELGPSNQSTYTGQTVTPTDQMFISFTPQQPYLSVQLNSQNLQWVASASGYGGASSSSVSAQCTATSRGGCTQITASGTSASSLAQVMTAFTPASSSWQIHYPMEVKVQESSGGSISTVYDQVTDLYSLGSNGMITINGGASSGGITIANVGAFSGQYTTPSLNDPAFFQSSYTCANFPTGWCGYDNGQSAISGFQNYWFGGSTSFSGPSSFIPSAGAQENPTYDCNTNSHPGWGQDMIYQQFPGSQATGSLGYFYYPNTPELVNNQPASSQTFGSLDGIYYDYSQASSCQGNSLVNYLSSQAATYNGNDYGIKSWNIQCASSTQCSLNEYIDPATMVIPALTAQVSTGLVGTVIAQQNNAQFTLGTITSKANTNGQANTLYAETSTVVTVPTTDTSSFPGTAQVCYSQSNQGAVTGTDCETQTIQPSQTFDFTFSVTAALQTQKSTDTLTFTVVNQAGQTTATSSITLVILPVPQGSAFYAITSLNAPSSMTVGSQAMVSASIKDIGGAQGTASILATSSDTTVATIVPSSLNQTISAGGTISIQFTLSAFTASSQPVTFTISVANSTGITDSRTFSVSISSGPCTTNCPPPPPPPGGLLLWVGIGIVVVAVAGFGAYYYKTRH